ncbi:DUF402 domain-containing protein [Skermania sp. ID1734]|uniref:DUF402 domain-containing protein n=1 Tax=Skermania sp. ID1734 TaxID=2597516 RepID=UPI0011813416|nr:DUF402 domain-containing protein [Skermania sp. ID1734]TSD98043.1 DUF402 domain-containing protein [Skermania sp. ID1734]
MKRVDRSVDTALEDEELHVHQPKTEVFNLVERTNTDPKGFVRPVQEFKVTPWGLYMARTADHPRFHYLESWLIPSLGLRASVFHYHYNDLHKNFYLDVGEFTPGEKSWTSVDHYLDIVVHRMQDVEVLDTDELLAAVKLGYLDIKSASKAFEHAFAAVAGLAQHGYRLDRWLASMDMQLTWH